MNMKSRIERLETGISNNQLLSAETCEYLQIPISLKMTVKDFQKIYDSCVNSGTNSVKDHPNLVQYTLK